MWHQNTSMSFRDKKRPSFFVKMTKEYGLGSAKLGLTEASQKTTKMQRNNCPVWSL